MVSAEEELKGYLMEAGRRLFSAPSDTEELLVLLNNTKTVLEKVNQSPSPSILVALRPVREMLVANNLLGHSNLEVKLAVASCINELIRITAPYAPYDDEQMKVICPAIVESFEEFLTPADRMLAALMCQKISDILEQNEEHNGINSSGQNMDHSGNALIPFDSQEVGQSRKKLKGKYAPLEVDTLKFSRKYKERDIEGNQENEKGEVTTGEKVNASLDHKGKKKAQTYKYKSLSVLYARSPRI